MEDDDSREGILQLGTDLGEQKKHSSTSSGAIKVSFPSNIFIKWFRKKSLSTFEKL
jgi:hypothetical protein